MGSADLSEGIGKETDTLVCYGLNPFSKIGAKNGKTILAAFMRLCYALSKLCKCLWDERGIPPGASIRYSFTEFLGAVSCVHTLIGMYISMSQK